MVFEPYYGPNKIIVVHCIRVGNGTYLVVYVLFCFIL